MRHRPTLKVYAIWNREENSYVTRRVSYGTRSLWQRKPPGKLKTGEEIHMWTLCPGDADAPPV